MFTGVDSPPQCPRGWATGTYARTLDSAFSHALLRSSSAKTSCRTARNETAALLCELYSDPSYDALT